MGKKCKLLVIMVKVMVSVIMVMVIVIIMVMVMVVTVIWIRNSNLMMPSENDPTQALKILNGLWHCPDIASSFLLP